MSFTPQPWRQVANEIVGPNGDVIADVTGGEGCRFVDDEDNVECLANARLISAAPTLLKALQESLAAMERMDSMLLNLTRQPKECEKREIAQARDAIALATL